MRKINEAYGILSDARMRESYKNWLFAKELNLTTEIRWSPELAENRGQMHFRIEEKLELQNSESERKISSRKDLRARFRKGLL